MSGAWIFICGPSGAGKDSVIAWARQALSEHKDIVFVRRLVTRAMHPGSDHASVTRPDFLSLLQNGGLRWHWQAHGFHYGVDLRYAADVQAGRLVLVNGSRAHVAGLIPAEGLRVVQITAGPATLAARLTQRGRDAPEAVAERLVRNAHFTNLEADCTIANDGDLPAAGQRLVDYLVSQERAMAAPALSRTAT
jgi:ribose 1,5-bisphosphokinase